MELVQIEEPGERSGEIANAGLAIGLELTGSGLRLAASVGGNVEIIRNAEGGLDFLPALAGYDEAGMLVAGQPGLADQTAIGLDALTLADGTDARGASVADRVALLIQTAGRRLVRLTGRPIVGAVVVVPLDSTAGLRLTLMQAVEAGGIPVLRLAEFSVAVAIGGGLDHRGDGAYLHFTPLVAGLALARLEVVDGVVRLVGGALARHVDEVPALIAVEGHVRGVIAPDVAATVAPEIARLDGFDGAERAVIGAALLAEALA